MINATFATNASRDPRTAPQVALSSASKTEYRLIFVYSVRKHDRGMAKTLRSAHAAAANVLLIRQRRLLNEPQRTFRGSNQASRDARRENGGSKEVFQPTVSIAVTEDEPRPVRSDTIARPLAFSSMLDRVNLATCAHDPFR